MRIWLSRILTLALLAFLFGCGGGGGGSSSAPGSGPGPQPPGLPPVRLVALEFDPATATLSQGFTLPLRLFALYSNGFRLDVTGQSQLLSNSPAVVLEGSLARAEQVGSATISGRKGRFFALATLSNGKRRDATHLVQWSVEPSSLATVEQGTGEVTASSPGNGEVVASLGLLQSSLGLTVETPLSGVALIAVPQRVRLAQSGQTPPRVFSSHHHSDVSELVNWTSDDAAVAEVVNGQIEARGPGQTTLTAHLGSQVSRITVEVFAGPITELRLQPTTLELPVGGQRQLRLEGVTQGGEVIDLTQEAEWTLTQPHLLAVVGGRLEALQEGTSSLTASARGLTSAPCQVTVQAAGGASPSWHFVDNRSLPGGDGSLNHPFNNLVEALKVVEASDTIFVFRGDGTPRGLVGELRLPDQLTLRGEGAGFAELGLTAGVHPQIVGQILSVGNHNILQGFHWNSVLSPRMVSAENVRDLTMSENGFFDRSPFTSPETLRFSNLEGLVRFNNNWVSPRPISDSEGLRWLRTAAGTEPTHLELTNNTIESSLRPAVRIETSGVASDQAPKLSLDCRNNQLTSPVTALLYNYQGPEGEVELVGNQAAGEIRLQAGPSAALLWVSQNSLGSLDLFMLGAGEVTVTNNTLQNRLKVSAAPLSLAPGTPEPPTVRVDNNQVLRTTSNPSEILIEVFARTTLLLFQGNEASTATVGFSSNQPVSKFGVRNNRIDRPTITVQGGFAPGLKFCTAISGNVGSFGQVLNSLTGTFELEGRSQLSTLNTLTTLFVAPGFVDVAVGSCDIPE